MAELYENKDLSIMCPNCGKFLTMSDKRDPRIHKLACRKCWKWIWWKPNNPEYRVIKKIPERTSSSGLRFY